MPEHYHFVAESLLGAIKDVLGEAATEEVLTAWGEAYWFLADVLMARESSIYSRLAAAPGGWSGWRDFVIESTKAESEVIRSFLLVPKDGGSILEHVVRTGSGRPLWYIHGAENGRVHAMGAHVRELAAQGRNVTVRTFYNVPSPGDQAGRDFDERGLISTSWLASHTPLEEAVYYLCGPRPFLRNMVGGLARTGVALNRILYEFFGPADELLAA